MIADLECVIVRTFELEKGEPCIQILWPGEGEEAPRAELIWGHENLRQLAVFIVALLKQSPGEEQVD